MFNRLLKSLLSPLSITSSSNILRDKLRKGLRMDSQSHLMCLKTYLCRSNFLTKKSFIRLFSTNHFWYFEIFYINTGVLMVFKSCYSNYTATFSGTWNPKSIIKSFFKPAAIGYTLKDFMSKAYMVLKYR